jgi:transcriptional regulator with XRE-family HTH domain
MVVKKKVAYERLLARERVLVEAMAALWTEIERTGMKKTDIAQKLDVSKPYVSQALNGGQNLTLRSLADFAWALESRVQISLSPADFDESRSFTVTSTTEPEIGPAATPPAAVVAPGSSTAFAEAA